MNVQLVLDVLDNGPLSAVLSTRATDYDGQARNQCFQIADTIPQQRNLIERAQQAVPGNF